MADQATVNRLQEGIKLAVQEGNNDLVQTYGKELRRLQQQEQVDLAKLEASVQASKPPRPTALEAAKDIMVSPIKGTIQSAAAFASLPRAMQEGIFSLAGQDISQAQPSIAAGGQAPQYQDIMNLIEKLPGAKRVTQYQAKNTSWKTIRSAW
jgi:hypothetical protein